tara:strand:+ start:4320 stop:5276 length:957 start_codon:yes stop_codon:yes gene_type:complete
MILNNYNFAKYFIENYKLENKPYIAVAVSGGPDSMALLNMMMHLSKKINAKIIALIVNHNLRQNSKSEVSWLFNKLSIKKISCKIIDIKKNHIFKRNMEEARKNRYKRLLNYCKKNNILHLCLAHHYDDIKETYLIRKISGSNFYGLRPMEKLSVNKHVCIIRPLLNFKKKQIYKYNSLNKIEFIEDPSNFNLTYSRSCVRKFIKDNKSFVRFINKDIRIINENVPLYNEVIWNFIISVIESINSKQISVNYNKFINSDVILKENAISKFYKFLYGDTKNVRYQKIAILLKELETKRFKLFVLKSMKITKKENFLIFI